MSLEEAISRVALHAGVRGCQLVRVPYAEMARFYQPLKAGDFVVMADGRLMEVVEKGSAGIVGLRWVLKEVYPTPNRTAQVYTHMGDTSKPVGPDGRFPEVEHGFSYFLKVLPH